jgi:AbrB family looped-hinge helix DNA binding protein
MEVEITRISEKGQIVIPSNLRKEMGIERSDQFLVFGEDNTIILKRIEKAVTQKSFDELAKPLRESAKKLSLTRRDLEEEIRAVRKSKNA